MNLKTSNSTGSLCGWRYLLKLGNFLLYWNSHRIAIFTMVFVAAVPASLIAYEHGVMRGVLFFIGVVCLFLVATLIPFRKSLRSKYGKSPFY
jgi:uncharacterized membrane protein YccC